MRDGNLIQVCQNLNKTKLKMKPQQIFETHNLQTDISTRSIIDEIIFKIFIFMYVRVYVYMSDSFQNMSVFANGNIGQTLIFANVSES